MNRRDRTGGGDESPPAADREEYVVPSRRLSGTRTEVLDELDEMILALVAMRQRLSLQPRRESRTRTRAILRLVKTLTLIAVLATAWPAGGQAGAASPGQEESTPTWQYGGFIDAAYLQAFNDPPNQLFRSRGTTWHLGDLYLNMAGAYAKRKATPESRWGAELLVHAGKDDEIFGFSATAPNLDGHDWLRQLGLANVSYQSAIGNGLTIQGGIFASLIGYDSLYAKDNVNYTRPWGADFTPYLMLGVNASYPLTDRLTGTFFVINGYWHLANANNVPSTGLQLAYKASDRVSVRETLLWGPHQANTSIELWRLLADTIVEHRTDRVTVAAEYHFATERVDASPRQRAWWMAAQLPVRWNVQGPFSLAVRPEFAWDSHGRWTLAEQTVSALTSTAEYRLPYKSTNTIVRLEHRFDRSRGPGGGFFTNDAAAPGSIGLTPNQHLVIVAAIVTFDR